MSKSLVPPPPVDGGRDRALLKGLRRADASAFDALYESYFPRIYSHFRRHLETVGEAENATEASFTAVFQEVWSAPSEMPLPRWIFRQVRGVELSLDRPAQGPAKIENLKVRPQRGRTLRSG